MVSAILHSHSFRYLRSLTGWRHYRMHPHKLERSRNSCRSMLRAHPSRRHFRKVARRLKARPPMLLRRVELSTLAP